MNPTEPRLLRVETVADLPILWATFQRMDLLATLERQFPPPLHWKGPLTPGEVLAIWLLFLVSQGDHCLNHVEPWVECHQGTLSALVGKPVRPADAQDDRLADWLTKLGADGVFSSLEQTLNEQTIRVYQLPTNLVRIDTTTANSYAGIVSDRGILQFGHSKDDPDRPQIKIAAAILDPLAMPLVTAVVPGNVADDPLYIPTIRSVQKSLGVGGRTYVGDCKMAAFATRAFVAAGKDFYLCPLSESQLSRARRVGLLEPVWAGTQAVEQVWRPGPDGQSQELVAEGFGLDVTLTGTVENQEVTWTEHRWLVRSMSYAASQEAGLERRLAAAVAEVRGLTARKQGKKRLTETELAKASEAVMERERVSGLLCVSVGQVQTTRSKRGYAGRPGHDEVEVSWVVEVARDEEAIQQKKQEMGWQVYGTNQSGMGLTQVVWAYRGQYRIENDWSRLKGQPLGLTPMYLQDEERIAGLVYLLSLALRILVLVEWVVREKLRQDKKKLRDIYPGQPGRKTMTPSAELLLGAMKSISISVVEVNGQIHIMLVPLTKLQKELLDLWGLPPDFYENVTRGFPKPHPNTSEP